MPMPGPSPAKHRPSLLPAIAGTAVILLALPVFLITGWRSRAGVRERFSGSARKRSAGSSSGCARGRVTSPPQAWLDFSCSFARSP